MHVYARERIHKISVNRIYGNSVVVIISLFNSVLIVALEGLSGVNR